MKKTSKTETNAMTSATGMIIQAQTLIPSKEIRLMAAEARMSWAMKNAEEILENAASVLERAAVEMRRSIHSLKNETSFYKAEEVLSAAVNNAAANILGNMRLDLMVTRAANIAAIKAEIRSIKGDE